MGAERGGLASLRERAVLNLVYPMTAMVFLTVVVLVRMFRSRVAAVRSGLIPREFYRLHQGGDEPEGPRKHARHFINLFESPTLFYAVCLAAMVSGVSTIAMAALAWAYVLCRVIHATVHLGANRLRHRVRIFGLSWLLLVSMWAYLAITVSLRS
jgi:hypothetical protein